LAFLIPSIGAPIFTLHIAIPGLTQWYKPYDFVFTWAQPLAVVWLIVMSGINYVGVKFGGAVQVFLTFIKIFSVLLIIGVAFLAPSAVHTTDPYWPAAYNGDLLAAFLAALAAALWAYDGWEDLNLVGSEVRDPQKNFPRALVGGVAVVAVIYLLLSAACLRVLPFAKVAASQYVASEVIEHISGRGAAIWVTLAMVISAVGSLNSSVLSGARVPYAIARDKLFFRVADGIHPKFFTPGRALIFPGVLTSLVALAATFATRTSLFICASWIFYGLAVVALFRLRKTEPNMPRPYRCPGYPFVPGVFVAGALALTISVLFQNPGRSSIGLALILLGLPFYRYWQKKSIAP